MKRYGLWALLIPAALLTAASPQRSGAQPELAAVEATSLLGRPLDRPELTEEFRERQSGLLAEARARLGEAPEEVDSWVWVGRRLAYLGRYREAVEVYSKALERFPDSAKLLRHRGHRMITLRRLDDAIADLGRAARLREGREDEVEPDGLPNPQNIPTSTLHSNIWYHLGLAHYLEGDFKSALKAYKRCMDVSRNPDMASATSHWLYMTLRRLGDRVEPARVLKGIRPDLEILENEDYFQLLLMYQREGEGADELLAAAREGGALRGATVGYGVANWHLYNGRKEQAKSLFEEIVTGDSWAAFGYIAAEAELARWE